LPGAAIRAKNSGKRVLQQVIFKTFDTAFIVGGLDVISI